MLTYIRTNILTYAHLCINIYSFIQKFVHKCLHTYIHTYIYTCVHIYINFILNTSIHAYINTCLHSLFIVTLTNILSKRQRPNKSPRHY